MVLDFCPNTVVIDEDGIPYRGSVNCMTSIMGKQNANILYNTSNNQDSMETNGKVGDNEGNLTTQNNEKISKGRIVKLTNDGENYGRRRYNYKKNKKDGKPTNYRSKNTNGGNWMEEK